jgi:2-dehydropantoate 2-reductase
VRYVVYGAGAVGGAIGAQLHQSGEEVVLVARGDHHDAIRAHGLTVVGPEGAAARFDLPVVSTIAAAAPRSGDIVLLTMKSQDSEEALRQLALAAPPEITLACVQNGVANERAAARLFARVYGVLVQVAAFHVEPGVVQADSGANTGALDIGRYPAGVDDGAEQLAAAFRRAGYAAEARADVMAWKYAKLVGNVANRLGALVGLEAVRGPLGEAIRAEAESVLHASGIAFVPRAALRERALTLTRHRAPLVNSTTQSLLRGGSIETDYLNGEIVLLARLHGVEAPANALIQTLVREFAAERRAAESFDIGELAVRLCVSLDGADDLAG